MRRRPKKFQRKSIANRLWTFWFAQLPKKLDDEVVVTDEWNVMGNQVSVKGMTIHENTAGSTKPHEKGTVLLV